jgi:hypothetical protein
VADGVDGVRRKAGPGQFHEDRGGGPDVLVRDEKAVLGLDDHDSGRAHAVELCNRPGKLPLNGAVVVGSLDKVREAELGLVEDLEADSVARRHPLGGEFHAETVDVFGRDQNIRATGGNLVGYALGLELGDDRRGILFGQPSIQELQVRLAGPEGQGGEGTEDADTGDGDRNALVDAELFPEGGQGLDEVFHARGAGGGSGGA